ncbi:hypothetical protein J1N35_028658 [Gossypium stocksii]|uniref:(+)-delta-cadinene synthase n=2 Tax=Gossypium TaxID=3633 RepID=A0A9D3UWM8_9ROSI|nr:hypothetical protein J1N35_028658 [Gossypium stocksii]
MAFCLFNSFPMYNILIHSKRKSFSYSGSSFRRLTVFSASQSGTTNKTSNEDVTITRRSANYHPAIWDYGYIQSLRNDFVQDESYKERSRKLKEEVRMMLGNVVDPLEKLELIDTLQRLGLSYHFEAEINNTWKNISTDRSSTAAWKKDNLYATALEFRLLRQHGYKVDQDVFTYFMDNVGNIKSSLNQDFKGLLNLYEASYLLFEGETMLENARELAAKLLKQYLKENNDHQYLSMLVDHALELPLHWRMPRLEARWFIDVYEKNKDKNPIILELAILDYNIVQSIHQEDLRYVSTWWKELGLGKRFSFARDRLMENFLWSAGMIISPEDGKIIDDVYDVYGTLDELELFTDVVERWDINAIQRLPDYMKIYYHALYNSINEMAFDTLKEQGINVIPFLKKLWTDLCKAYLLEAKWYYIGYTPTLQEYIDNAWISVGGSLMLAHSYLVTDHIKEEGLHSIQENYSDIVYRSSVIIRLANDLGTSSYELKRGDIPKSVQCYMHESGASEEEACEHIRKLIDSAWKKINEDQMAKLLFSRKFIEITKNIARVSLLMYQNGDGHGIENEETKDRVLTVFSASQIDTTNKTSIENTTITRRSANYHPPIWDYGYVQSLRNDFVQDKSYKVRARKLKEEVRMMLGNVVDPLEKLELIDTLQRLGLSYHFEAEINKTLKNISTNHISTVAWKKDNLYATALEFRLLRQHGYKVDQDVFTCFMDDVGNIKSSLYQDFKGLLNLYEASYLLLEGETMLENARELVAKLLKQYLKENNDHQYLWTLVDHALELPLHWRMPRLEARWFIEAYEKNKDKNPIILELAILDYNIVQSIHQEDLRYVSTWWKELGIGKRFSFARDRLMENFLWGAGMILAPQDGKSRIILTKVNALITVIDDVYDVYGTLDELELFTDVVERWDINAIQRLPDYMKIYYHALYNSVNEMAFDTLKEQGIDVIPFLKKVWTDLCKAYLVEAKWYYIGYTPTLKEYIDNAWISIGCCLMLAHAYLVTSHITEEGLHNIQENYSGIYQSSIITRLANDLGTSPYELKRGDVSKSVQCYMYESGASEEEAREYIRKLIDAAWKKINEDQMAKLPFSQTFIESTKNIARVSLLMYQNGDGHGIEDKETKDRVLSLFVHPISLPK